jgi:hypothetical protein
MQILENWIVFDIKNRYSKLAKFNMLPKIFGKKFTSFWMVQVRMFFFYFFHLV